jgi:TM2 domain-containing membrane protein YozV
MLVAVFLGWDRFFLGDVGMGVLKILTCYGFWIWWIIDMFTATERTKRYNYKKFMEAAAFMR